MDEPDRKMRKWCTEDFIRDIEKIVSDERQDVLACKLENSMYQSETNEEKLQQANENIKQKIFEGIRLHMIGNIRFNYNDYTCEEGKLIPNSFEEFLEKLKSAIPEKFKKIAEIAKMSQQELEEIRDKAIENMRIKKEDCSFAFYSDNSRRLSNYSSLSYKKELGMGQEERKILKEFKELIKQTMLLETLAAKLDHIMLPGYSLERQCKTKLEGKCMSLSQKKEIMKEMLKAKKAEIIIETNVSQFGFSGKYVLGLKGDTIVFAFNPECEYHNEIAYKYDLDYVLGGGKIENKRNKKDVAGKKLGAFKIDGYVGNISADYGAEPRKLTELLLKKAMPWCFENKVEVKDETK